MFNANSPNKLTKLRDMLSEDSCDIAYGDPRNFTRNNIENEDPNIEGQTAFSAFDYGLDDANKEATEAIDGEVRLAKTY